ncbi:MAG: aldehyde dehydrogenase family protein [Micromonosporaceae bacterium]
MIRIVSRSPQAPSDVVVDVLAADVGSTVDNARAAQPGWAAAPAPQRAAALSAMADAVAGAAEELTQLVVREVGKPVTEATGEVARTVAILRYYAQQALDPYGETYPPAAGGLAFTVRRPRGVAGLITPWNFPLAIPMWKAAPAIAFGNAAVIKPSPESTACALRLAELFAGVLPDGVLSVLPGGAETGSALVDAVDLVSFTGSGTVGRQIAVVAAGRGIPAQCEMGGLSASVVLPDADPERAARQIAYAAMGFAGQKCTATKRIIVVGDPSEFTDALQAALSALTCGDPADAGVAVGPVISAAAARRVREAIDEAVAAGGKLLTAAGTHGAPLAASGRPVTVAGDPTPTIVTGLPPDARLNREEVFGPVCALTAVSDVDAALRLADATGYGLVTSLYTDQLDVALRFVETSRSGMVKVNAPTAGVDFHLPFGGEKQSGYGGREQGKAARDFYTSARTVQLSAL